MSDKPKALELADQAEQFAHLLTTKECKDDWFELAKILREQHAETERLTSELSNALTDAECVRKREQAGEQRERVLEREIERLRAENVELTQHIETIDRFPYAEVSSPNLPTK